jgi:hypothetical protein
MEADKEPISIEDLYTLSLWVAEAGQNNCLLITTNVIDKYRTGKEELLRILERNLELLRIYSVKGVSAFLFF